MRCGRYTGRLRGWAAAVLAAAALAAGALAAGTGQPAAASARTATFAYVVNVDSNDVSVIDAASRAVVATIPVGGEPRRAAVTGDGAEVYVTDSGSGTVSVISTATNQVIRTVTVGTRPLGIAVSPDGTKVYVANSGSGDVSIIDTSTDRVSGTLTVGGTPMDVAFSPDGTHFLVSGIGAGCPVDHCILDFAYPANNQIGTISNIRGSGERVSFLDGTTAFVVNGCGQCGNLEKISTASESRLADVGLGGSGTGLAIAPDKGSVFASADHGTHSVQRFDPASMSRTGSVPVTGDVTSLAFTPGGQLYAAEDNQVVIIDPSTLTVTGGPIPVGTRPVDVQMATVTVKYVFHGFFPPVRNVPAINTGKAGQVYPLKWQLLDENGNFISRLSAVSGIAYKRTSCSAFTTDPTGAVRAAAAGGTSLRYDHSDHQYVFDWATPRAGCRTLFVSFDDGTTRYAYFHLTR